MTTASAPTARTTRRSPLRPLVRGLAVATATVAIGAITALAVPAVAMAADGPILPGGTTFQGPPTTPPPPEPPDPQVNPDVVPDVDQLTPVTTVPEPPFPPDPPDPEVNPDVVPDADDFAPATTAPEPPLPPDPPVDEDDEVAPTPQDCEPFDPSYPVVDIVDQDTSATVALSLQGDDQLQLCVTPLVVATYALSEPGFGGQADLLAHEVLSSEDLDDWLLTGEPVTVDLPLEGCYHATVVFWGVAIPLDLDGVADPPHVLTSAIGGDGCDGPGGDPGGRLPETGAAVLAGVWLAAGLIGAGTVVWLVAARRRRPADGPTA